MLIVILTFSVVDVETALGKLKTGKSPGIDGIVKEHLLYSHPSIIVHLTLLFNINVKNLLFYNNV